MFRFFCISLICFFSHSFAGEEKPPVKDEIFESKGQIGELHYKVKSGQITLHNKEDKAQGHIFFVAYTKEGEEAQNRPITFCFNGGPGSSSVWLHLGTFGPKRIDFNKEGTEVLSNRLIDNEETILDLTDLVFIDPISCGFSKVAAGEDPKQYHGVDEDIKSIGEFIRLYLAKEHRFSSPKYLAGESYGTTRAVGLAEHLLLNDFIRVDGIVLVSTVLNFQTISDKMGGNDLPYPLFLPTFAAASWHHKKLPAATQNQNLKALLKSAETFALTDYTLALTEGDRLSPDKKKQIAKKLHNFTGLSEELLLQENLRPDWYTYCNELTKRENRIVGRFDGRILGTTTKNDKYQDPSLFAISGGFSDAINHYLRADLKWEKKEPYHILNDVFPWNYGQAKNQYLNMSQALITTLNKNPKTKVFVGSGLFDLATPYFSVDYTLNHLGLEPEDMNRIIQKYYPAGHMFYTNEEARKNFKKDLIEFYK